MRRTTQGDADHRERHDGGGGEGRVHRQAGGVQALEDEMGEAGEVIADRRYRQALDRLLQAQLRAHALVHGAEEAVVLALEIDLDAGAQELRRARQLLRQVGLALLGGGAGAHGRVEAARQELRPAREAAHRRLADGGRRRRTSSS